MDTDDEYGYTEEDSRWYASTDFQACVNEVEAQNVTRAYIQPAPGGEQPADDPGANTANSVVQTILNLSARLWSSPPPSRQESANPSPGVDHLWMYPALPSPPRTPSPQMPGTFRSYRESSQADSPALSSRISQNRPPALLSDQTPSKAGVSDKHDGPLLVQPMPLDTPHLSQRTSQLSLDPSSSKNAVRLFAPQPARTVSAPVLGTFLASTSPSKAKRAFDAMDEDGEDDSLQDSPSARRSQRPRLETAIEPLHFGNLARPQTTAEAGPISIHSPHIHNFLKEFPWSFRYAMCQYVSNGLMEWNQLDLGQLFAIRQFVRDHPTHPDLNVAVGMRAPELLPEDKRGKTKAGWQAVLSALDEEEAILRDTRTSRSKGEVNWPAGQVSFRASLRKAGGTDKTPGLKLELRSPILAVQNSNRFSRKLGSRALLSVTIDDDLLRNIDASYLHDRIGQGLLIDGTLFHAICAKDGTITFVCDSTANYVGADVKTSEDFWMWFVTWHNDWKLDHAQSMTKWGARMQLGLSDSLAGPTLQRANILSEPDIIASGCEKKVKPPSEMIMTDGAGFMSSKVALHIQRLYNLLQPPAAIQVRVSGAKGLLVMCPLKYDKGDERIWIRPSQIKSNIRSEHLQDPSLRTIDALRPSDYASPSRITSQLILNLHDNHVPTSTLCELLCFSLKEAAEPFIQYGTRDDGDRLCKAIEVECRLVTARLSRFGALLRGHETSTFSTQHSIPPYPATREEATYCSLSAGFSPGDNKVLHDSLKFILKNITSPYVNEFRFSLPQTLDAYIIPDPLGILEEGEIAFNFPEPYQEADGAMIDCLTGDVLLYRNPGLLASDTQKVRAVDRSSLRMWKGVIIMSTRGTRSLASLLSGGDYDGDRAILIWDQRLVSPFRNAPLEDLIPPAGLDDCIQTTGETSEAFDMRTVALDPAGVRKELQKYLLAGMKNDYVMERYSHLHNVAAAAYGLHDPRTRDLAYKYNIALDSPKSGLKIKQKVRKKDNDMYDRKHPWKVDKGTGKRKALNREAPGEFILKTLRDRGNEKREELLNKFDAIHVPAGGRMGWKYPDLAEPWEDFQDRAASGSASMQASCKAIEAHVQAVFQQYISLKAKRGKRYLDEQMGAVSPGTQKPDYNSELVPIREAFWSNTDACNVNNCMSQRELRAVLASYAHVAATWRTNFAFDVAFWDICRLKADATFSLADVEEEELAAGKGHPAPTVSKQAFMKMTMNNRLVGKGNARIGRSWTA